MKKDTLLFYLLAIVLCLTGCGRSLEPTYEGKTLNQWIDQLRSGNVQEQREAVNVIREIGQEANEALPALLTTPFILPGQNMLDFTIRGATIQSVLRPDEQRNIDAIIGALTIGSGQEVSIGGGGSNPLYPGKTDMTFIILLQVFRELGKPVVPDLIEVLDTPIASAKGRFRVAVMLGQMGKNAVEAIPALKQRLKDKDRLVRHAANRALLNIAKEVPEALEIQDCLLAIEAMGDIPFVSVATADEVFLETQPMKKGESLEYRVPPDSSIWILFGAIPYKIKPPNLLWGPGESERVESPAEISRDTLRVTINGQVIPERDSRGAYCWDVRADTSEYVFFSPE